MGGFYPSFLNKNSVRRRRIGDPSVLPIQTKFPAEHQPQFSSYPYRWLKLAIFQEFFLNEAQTSLPVIQLEACCHLQKVFSWPLWTASCWIADLHYLCLPVAGTSWKRRWACVEQFEGMCWGILGTPHPRVWSLVSNFWGTQNCCAPCSGKPDRLATRDIDVQVSNTTHFLITGSKHFPQLPLQLMGILSNSPSQCCEWLEEWDRAERRKSPKCILCCYESYLLP